jgi:pimeloyl-ACP methyl ester carboxylesterase
VRIELQRGQLQGLLAIGPETGQIGHSLGGLLAPEIADRAGGVAGVVLLAPPGRSPWDILRAQMRYLHAPRETRASIERAMIENTSSSAAAARPAPPSTSSPATSTTV